MLPSPSALKSPCRHGQELQHRILNQSLFKTRNSLTRLFPLKKLPVGSGAVLDMGVSVSFR